MGWWIYRRYGATARASFDDWVGRTYPAGADVLRQLERGAVRG